MIARIEYLLVLAQVYLHQAKDPMIQLAQALDQSQRSAMLALEVELLFAGAEVAWLSGDPVGARES